MQLIMLLYYGLVIIGGSCDVAGVSSSMLWFADCQPGQLEHCCLPAQHSSVLFQQ